MTTHILSTIRRNILKSVKKYLIAILSMVLVLTAHSALANVNHVTNGSFEALSFSNPSDGGPHSIEAWRRVKGDIVVARNTRRGVDAFDQSSMLMMRDYPTSRLNSKVKTIIGQPYILSFYSIFSEPSHVDSDEHMLDLIIDGIVVETVNSQAVDWQLTQYAFIATETITNIGLRSKTTGVTASEKLIGRKPVVFIDAVSLVNDISVSPFVAGDSYPEINIIGDRQVEEGQLVQLNALEQSVNGTFGSWSQRLGLPVSFSEVDTNYASSIQFTAPNVEEAAWLEFDYVAQDTANNVAVRRFLVEVLPATSIPAIGNLIFTSTASNSSYALLGDTVTLTFQSSEPIEAPTVDIGGLSFIATGDGINWEVSFVVTEDFSNGPINFTIENIEGLSGNEGLSVSEVDAENSVAVLYEGLNEIYRDDYCAPHDQTTIFNVIGNDLGENFEVYDYNDTTVSGDLNFNNGRFSYTPNVALGADSFTYRATNGLLISQDVTIDVAITNDETCINLDWVALDDGEILPVISANVGRSFSIERKSEDGSLYPQTEDIVVVEKGVVTGDIISSVSLGTDRGADDQTKADEIVGQAILLDDGGTLLMFGQYRPSRMPFLISYDVDQQEVNWRKDFSGGTYSLLTVNELGEILVSGDSQLTLLDSLGNTVWIREFDSYFENFERIVPITSVPTKSDFFVEVRRDIENSRETNGRQIAKISRVDGEVVILFTDDLVPQKPSLNNSFMHSSSVSKNGNVLVTSGYYISQSIFDWEVWHTMLDGETGDILWSELAYQGRQTDFDYINGSSFGNYILHVYRLREEGVSEYYFGVNDIYTGEEVYFENIRNIYDFGPIFGINALVDESLNIFLSTLLVNDSPFSSLEPQTIKFRIDKIVPEILKVPYVSIDAINQSNSNFNSGTVELNFEATTELNGLSVMINGQEVVTETTPKGSFTKYTSSVNVLCCGSGEPIAFEINYIDEISGELITLTSTTDGSAVIHTAPVFEN